MRKVSGSGPRSTDIMLVGDMPTFDDEHQGRLFVGQAGAELDRMLHEAGLLRGECYLTTTCKYRGPLDNWLIFRKKAPEVDAIDYEFTNGAWVHKILREGIDELWSEISKIQPNLIVVFGDVSLWALTEISGLNAWRGSIVEAVDGRKLLPTFSPSLILKQWELRPVVVHDLRRANRERNSASITQPEYDFTVRPSFEQVNRRLDRLLELLNRGQIRLSIDIETRNYSIACVGIAWSKSEAICIPFQSVTSPSNMYWSFDEHAHIVGRLKEVLGHRNCRGVGQNFSFDQQYFLTEFFFRVHITDDTMVAQHVLMPGTPKDLAYLSSLYCENHIYWKDDGKEWDPRIHDEEQLWRYNCIDAARTFEIIEQQIQQLEKQGMTSQYHFQLSLLDPVSDMSMRGVRINTDYRGEMAKQLIEAIDERNAFITHAIGYPLNVKSPKQMKKFLYEDMGLPPIYKRKMNKKGEKPVTADKEALLKCAEKEPLLRPITDRMADIRTMGIFLSNFVSAALDSDNRLRCMYQPAGPETFRFSSAENAFGSGTNMQNIPRLPDEDKADKLPPIRKLFIPSDPSFELAEPDLSGADAMVVAWECDDEVLKEIMTKRLKLAAENAKMLYGSAAGPDGRREPYYTHAKQGCHATNYGAHAKTVAATIGITIHEAEKFQKRWFEIHPNIRKWQKDVEHRLQTTRMVTNKFGYRRIYLGRIELALPEALAWIPQSTVACVINRVFMRIVQNVPNAHVLMQVHDSLIFEYKKSLREQTLRAVKECFNIVVPYDPPLIIPADLKVSDKSWGDCEKMAWPN